MKISEAIMYAIQKAGSKVEYYQFAEWISHLIKNGYLELIYDGEGDRLKVYLQLTKKGVTYIHTKEEVITKK